MNVGSSAFRFTLRVCAILVCLLVVPLGLVQLSALTAPKRTLETLQRLAPQVEDQVRVFDAIYAAERQRLCAGALFLASPPEPHIALVAVHQASQRLTAVTWHAPSGEPLETVPEAASAAYLSRLDLVALPTLGPVASPPYSPERGGLAVAVICPAHPASGAVLGYLSGEIDLSADWSELVAWLQAHRLEATLVDRNARRILGEELSGELAAQAASLTRMGNKLPLVFQRSRDTVLAVPLAELGWSLAVRWQGPQTIATLEPLVLLTLMAGGIVLMLGLLKRG